MQKATLITGCSTGIGRALALEFQRRGHVVYATARRIETLHDLRALGIRTAPLDVNDAHSIKAMMLRVQQDGAVVDMLVNNAGFGLMGPLAELPMADLRLQFETNVLAVVALVQAVLPGMVKQGSGRIVNIGSVSGILATPFAGAYSATKAAVHLLSDALRMELAPFGIKLITVQPGGIQSQFAETAGKGVSQRSGTLSYYAPVAEAIVDRSRISQQGATPVDVFARKLVDAVLANNPRSVVRIGRNSRLAPFLKRWLPTRLADSIMSRRFQLHRLQR